MADERVCSAIGCDKPQIARALCPKHYDAWRRHGDPLISKTRTRGSCSYPGCDRPHASKGYCGSHYSRLRRHGSVRPTRNEPGSALKYLNEIVLPYQGDDCLKWPFSKTGRYASVKIDGKNTYVMRIVCEQHYGKPPTPEHQVAHSCYKNPLCCTPGHLRWATIIENEADKLEHGTVRAKLSVTQVLQIRELESVLDVRSIAKRYNVSVCAVYNIHRRKTWNRI